MAKNRRVFSCLITSIVSVLVIGLMGFLYLKSLDKPLPKHAPSEAAERLTDQLFDTLGCEAWDRVKVLKWTFKNQRTHVWDRQRDQVQSTFADTITLIQVADQDGVAYRNGQILTGPLNREAVDEGWSHFINDAFWLNPFCSFRNQGTVRSLIEWDGKQGLLVSFGQGGVTPGDTYLVFLDEQGRPNQWLMWVSIIPIGGLSTTWEDWKVMGEGALISHSHRLGPFNLDLTVEIADSVSDLNLDVDLFSKQSDL